MKICRKCLNSNRLCRACYSKLKKGEITNTDVEVSRAMHQLMKETGIIAGFEQAIDTGNRIIIISQDVRNLVERNNVRRLAKILNKPVRIISKPRTPRELIERLLGAIPLLGINVLYANSGEVYRISVKRDFRKRMPLEPDEFSYIVKKIVNKDVELVFE